MNPITILIALGMFSGFLTSEGLAVRRIENSDCEELKDARKLGSDWYLLASLLITVIVIYGYYKLDITFK